jgi:DNA-binding NtrC family response regulator
VDGILLVDDRLIENEVLQEILVESGYEVIAEVEPGRVISLVRLRSFDLVILDLSMSGQNGVELVHRLHRIQPTLPILIMTDSTTIENAVVALREGAFDCLKKPFMKEEFLLAVDRVIRNSALARENVGLRERIQREKNPQG